MSILYQPSKKVKKTLDERTVVGKYTRDETKEILEGIFRVGAGPEPGEVWVPVKPALLGKLF